MSARVVARLFLPLEMGCVASVMAAIAQAYPGARVGDSGDPLIVELVADTDTADSQPVEVHIHDTGAEA